MSANLVAAAESLSFDTYSTSGYGTLVELALDKAALIDGELLDLGTGTGAIALALASELPTRQVTGIDLRPEAAELARENATRLAIHNAQFFRAVGLAH